MANYRPLTDMMIMARPKVPFYGAFPSGSLRRMRDLLGVRITTPVLHVCSGRIKDYPFDGFGPNDRTLDLDEKLEPNFHADAREIGSAPGDLFPLGVTDDIATATDHCHMRKVEKGNPPPDNNLWPAILIDRPYTEEDAAHYLEGKGEDFLPPINDLLRRCLSLVRAGGRVGVLDYFWPRPPKTGVRLVAVCGVLVGYGNRIRVYSVYEKLAMANAPSEDGGVLEDSGEADDSPQASAKAKRSRAKKDAPTTPPAAHAGATADCSGEASHAGLDTKDRPCVACGGTGKNSKGGPCGPCANVPGIVVGLNLSGSKADVEARYPDVKPPAPAPGEALDI